MLVSDVHALNDVLFIFSNCHYVALLRSLVEVLHMTALETS